MSADSLRDLISPAGTEAQRARYHDHPNGASTLLDTLEERPAIFTVDSLPDGEVMDELAVLAAEYRKALLDGGRDYRRSKYVVGSVVDVMPSGEFPCDGSIKVPAGTLLGDLLGDKSIDLVIEQLDPFGSDQLLAPAERYEILSLFAPRNLQRRKSRQAASLARQEHHISSMDSCLPMPDARTALPEEGHS
ncbi:MAG: TagK domain-containing protein [Cupriavidus sp.]|nr:TagK domain-containing protein [Cupriavidus sp.]